MAYVAKIDKIEYMVTVNEVDANKYEVAIDDKSYIVDTQLTESSVYSLIVNGKSYETDVDYNDGVYSILTEGDLFKIEVMDELKKKMMERRGGGAAEGKQVIKSEMPGAIIDVKVNVGDQVNEGDVLLILEAMKMQNEIRSPKDGEVKEVFVKAGENIEADAKMVVVE
jgi:biotin carboxyl carrier protein